MIGLPGFAPWTYVELLAAFFVADLTAERREAVVAAAQSLSADDRSIAACRVRGFTISHADWILAARRRAALRLSISPMRITNQTNGLRRWRS
jgi:hypothetical protein